SAHLSTIESTELALLPLPPAGPAGPARLSQNFVIEDRLAWSGPALLVTGMGEERDGRYTATEPRLYRSLGGDPRLERVSPALAGGVAEMAPLASGAVLTVTARSTHMAISAVDPASGAERPLRDQHGWVFNLTAARRGERIAFVAGDA